MHLCRDAQQDHHPALQRQPQQILYPEGELKLQTSTLWSPRPAGWSTGSIIDIPTTPNSPLYCTSYWDLQILRLLIHICQCTGNWLTSATCPLLSFWFSGDWDLGAMQLYSLHHLQHHYWDQQVLWDWDEAVCARRYCLLIGADINQSFSWWSSVVSLSATIV